MIDAHGDGEKALIDPVPLPIMITLICHYLTFFESAVMNTKIYRILLTLLFVPMLVHIW